MTTLFRTLALLAAMFLSQMFLSQMFSSQMFSSQSALAQVPPNQTYPNKTIRMIVTFAPGGPTDVIGRIIAQKVSESWGQQVVVENVPGGGGNMVSASISPADPNIILQGSDVGGVYRSADGGVTWSVRNGALVDPTRFSGYGMYGHFGFDPIVLTARENWTARSQHLLETLYPPALEVHRVRSLGYSYFTERFQDRSPDDKHYGLLNLLSMPERCLYFPDYMIRWVPEAIRISARLIRERHIPVILTSSPLESSHLIGLELKRRLGSAPRLRRYKPFQGAV